MYHQLRVHTATGQEYLSRFMDTTTVVNVLSALGDPERQHSLAPLEVAPLDTERASAYRQVHIRTHHIVTVEAEPAVWVGVRSMFLQEGSVWEMPAGALGKGLPATDLVVKVQEMTRDTATFVVIAPTPLPGRDPLVSTLALATFVEVTSPVSVDRLMDHGIVLNHGETIGHWPTDEELTDRLSS